MATPPIPPADPAVRPPVLPDWNVLPQQVHCPFFYRPTVRKVAGYTALLATVATSITHRWAYHNLRATPAVVINSLRALWVLGGALTVSAAAALLFPKSIKAEEERLRLRREAGADILHGDDLLPYPEIRRRHNHLLMERILVNADIDTLIQNEIPRIPFFEFNNKHTISVLDRLSRETKLLLIDKFNSEVLPAETTFKTLSTHPLILALEIQPEAAVQKLFYTPAVSARCLAADYTFTQFMEEHGENALPLLPSNIKNAICTKFFTFVKEQGLTKDQVDTSYGPFCETHFGFQKRQLLMRETLLVQSEEMKAGRITAYAEFCRGNGSVWVQRQLAQDAQFNQEARKCFLDPQRTSYEVQVGNTYKTDRELMEITVEDCIDAINSWLARHNIPYRDYRGMHSPQLLHKLTPEIQARYKAEIIAILVATPSAMPRFATEMKYFELTADQIYIQRWQAMSFDEIIAKDGTDFFTFLSAPKNIKEHILKEIGNRSLKDLILKHPRLFKEFLQPTDKTGEPEKTLAEKMENELSEYKHLAQVAQAIGPDFYRSGFVSEAHVIKVVSYYLGVPGLAQRAVFDPNPMPIEAPLPVELEKALASAREKVKVANELSLKESGDLNARHATNLKTLDEGYKTKLDACEEKKALRVAEEAHKPNEKALDATTTAYKYLLAQQEKLQNELSKLNEDLKALRALHGNVKTPRDEAKLAAFQQEFDAISKTLKDQDLPALKRALDRADQFVHLHVLTAEIASLDTQITTLKMTDVQGAEAAQIATKQIELLTKSLGSKRVEKEALESTLKDIPSMPLDTAQKDSVALKAAIEQLEQEQKPLLETQAKLRIEIGNYQRRLDGPMNLKKVEQALTQKQNEIAPLAGKVSQAETQLEEVKVKAEASAQQVTLSKDALTALDKREKERVESEKKALAERLDQALKDIETTKKSTLNAAYTTFFEVLAGIVNPLLKADLSQPEYNWQVFRKAHSSPILQIMNPENIELLKGKFMARNFEETGTLLGSELKDWFLGLGIEKLTLARRLFETESHKARLRRDTYSWELFCLEYGADCLPLLPDDLKTTLPHKKSK